MSLSCTEAGAKSGCLATTGVPCDEGVRVVDHKASAACCDAIVDGGGGSIGAKSIGDEIAVAVMTKLDSITSGAAGGEFETATNGDGGDSAAASTTGVTGASAPVATGGGATTSGPSTSAATFPSGTVADELETSATEVGAMIGAGSRLTSVGIRAVISTAGG